MTFRLFDAPLREPSQFVGFAGNTIDRQSENRADDSVERALADPSARLLPMHGGRLYLKLHDGSFDPWFDLAESQKLQPSLAQGVLLGFAESGPVLAVPVGLDPEQLPETMKAIDYRSVYMQGLIDEAAAGALAQGAALLAWHATHRFCSKCGHESHMRAGGYKRHCPNCGTEHFPRTDPVAIMLTATREKCLLGRGRHFGPGMYSALAGFIEPGETIEAAVRRETLEEAGIRLGRVVYHASQPWPFPYSLMIGCFGEPLNDDIQADLNELEDCRWFFRDEVRSMLERTHKDNLVTPPKGAIAHHLIRAWVDSE
ncbi:MULTISPECIES: NAD(+) diphosphatase [unclassified Mesorhizobium]|uniref:NAD(+) diphosphatase n=1 Tax=unclassified Mesorhizobium TaxID=325217 RepID=UPI0003CE10F9|nr:MULTISPECIES: NAD(+) diphosphatase [unclassified Mesorhizobium]ESW70473.1 DNA mismatch repair protein MutT [Mesorhizobium sp. LSJC277A00]ESX28442.1 DNA mismatch repair protein MutT [Mesorhizobium sp. LSHC440B00]ESX28614.1 DNA mismatch repair protein MutT [Mesorhizobium sp. LSJC264A00]ESX37389.1 DNA mismatch repair protein MutT [Mesorhizobium sp. LSHC432A00]ESX42276.1 DNA mismatch repair protein MutT [Mesorhizobium sp. LSHC440A00]